MIDRQQRNWRFLHDGGTRLAPMSSYDFRASIAKLMPDMPVLDIAVRASRLSMLVSPLRPSSNLWMKANEGLLMSAVAELAGNIVPLKHEFADIGCRNAPVTLYVIPELVVMKKGDFTAWRAEALDDVRTKAMHDMIHDGMRNLLVEWGVHDPFIPLTLIDPGKPMPLVKSSGPRGMARLNVRFVAPVHIDGNLFVGGFPMLGHGKVIRGGVVHGA